MPFYAFRCPQCGRTAETFASISTGPSPQLCTCGAHMRRVFHAPAVTHGDFDTHFNHSVGSVVHSRQDFRSKLARKSEEMSERLGMTVNYKELPHDAHPQRDEIKELQRKKAVEQRHVEPKRVFG